MARNALDDALADAVRADVLLIQVLQELRQDAEMLKNAADEIESALPSAPAPRRDI